MKDIFPTWFLLTLLAVSIATNLVFLAREARFVLPFGKSAFPAINTDDHVRGSAGASTTIVEYSDFQCPFCAAFHQSMRQFIGERNVRWIYRHYPLAIHPMALPAAEAAECAADQGKFWEYADALFDRQSRISADGLLSIAADLRLDLTTFGSCVRDGRHRDRALRDARAIGPLVGTPTSYVNGRRLEGTISLEELRLLR